MYRSILVPLDGSPFGEHSLPLAVALARRTGAALHLVHVHVPAGPVGALEAVPYLAAQHEVVIQREHAYLEEARGRLSRLGVPAEARLADGPVARTLAEEAREAGVDLVVLSTHAHLGVSRLWHRGVAAHLTRSLSVPIVLVHAPEGAPALDAEPAPRRVLLPLGGKAYSERVLEHAAELGRAFGARFTLLEVVAPPIEVGYTLMGQDGHVNEFQLEARREEALRYLEGVAGGLRARGLEVDAEVVASADAAEGIVGYAERAAAAGDPVGLIAMETHGLGGAAHLFTPGVVEKVAHQTTIPVLVHDAAVAERAHAADDATPRLGWPLHRHGVM